MSKELSLESYLNDVRRTTLLTEERERELARRIIRYDDQAAREEMIVSNLRLVVKIAKKYANKGLDFQDLIAEGNIGLLMAVDGFNPDLGNRFATYAVWWIKQSIKRALNGSTRSIHVPAYMLELIAHWRTAQAETHDKLGRPARRDELAAHMKIPKRRVRAIERALVAMKAPIHARREEDHDLMQEVHDQNTPSSERVALLRDDICAVGRMLKKLAPRDAEVVRLHYGLESERSMTLREIGVKFGLSRERVRQIESEALTTLRVALAGVGSNE